MQDAEAGRGGASVSPLMQAEDVLSACTSCGVCNAHCPTFEVTGDERDSPRGRIAMIRALAAREAAGAPSAAMADGAANLRVHLDRCATCLACMPACPEQIDFAAALEATRTYLGTAHQSRRRSRLADIASARLADPTRLRRLLRLVKFTRPLRTMVSRSAAATSDVLQDRADQVPFWSGEYDGPGTAKTSQERKARVILLAGCTQKVLRPSITDAAIRLLGRRGVDVIVPPGTDCCGAIDAQMGRHAAAVAHASANMMAWNKAVSGEEGIDYLVTSGATCGARVRRYETLFPERMSPGGPLAKVVNGALDVTELLGKIDIGPPVRWFALRVGYLGSCALRSAGVEDQSIFTLLARSGFTVRGVERSMACCGGVGAYPVVASDLARKMREGAVSDVARAGVDLLAVHDVGCLSQLSNHASTPVAHVVELIDWAYGGPTPPGLQALEHAVRDVPLPRDRDREAAGPVGAEI